SRNDGRGWKIRASCCLPRHDAAGLLGGPAAGAAEHVEAPGAVALAALELADGVDLGDGAVDVEIDRAVRLDLAGDSRRAVAGSEDVAHVPVLDGDTVAVGGLAEAGIGHHL